MPLDNDDLRVLQSLRDQARAALAEALGEQPSPVILVGTPRHRNLGDTFIWDGQRRLLEEQAMRDTANPIASLFTKMKKDTPLTFAITADSQKPISRRR